MTSQPLDRWPKWRDALVYHLRMEDVPGDRIGDILLEADAHLQDSGEAPEDAFGDARHYAAARATDTEPRDNAPLLWLIAFGAFGGSYLTVDASMGLGRGAESTLHMPPWLALAIGLALLVVNLQRLPQDLVRHPSTDQPLFREYPAARFALLGFVAIAAVGFYVIGRMLG